MIEAICADCFHLFMAPVILGKTRCPKCGSKNTYVAVDELEKSEKEQK